MKKGEIRDLVITGTFMIGHDGLREPAHGWKDYVDRLEEILIENDGVLPGVGKNSFEHYYVMLGNEFGVDLESKKNFTKIEDAKKYFEDVKFEDFVCVLMHVDSSGAEKMIEQFIDD